MRKMFGPLLALALSFTMVLAHAARDPADNEGTAEHPEVTRFPGFFIDNSKRNDFNEYCFAKNNEAVCDASGIGDTRAGKYWFVDYILKDNARQPSNVELMRNYENAFKAVGGTLVSRHPKTGAPDNAVFRVPRPGGSERWVQLSIDNEGARYQLHIIDTAAMVQKVEFSASQMAEAIRKNGFVALSGIQFDTGKATLKAESTPLLNEVLALLASDKAIKLSIEGHTDNVGDKRANLELSRRRAEAVVVWLTGKGVDSKRLKADGKGDTAPVADNRSEDGRAKNRRVELVKF